jgi:hypothetical protein
MSSVRIGTLLHLELVPEHRNRLFNIFIYASIPELVCHDILRDSRRLFLETRVPLYSQC